MNIVPWANEVSHRSKAEAFAIFSRTDWRAILQRKLHAWVTDSADLRQGAISPNQIVLYENELFTIHVRLLDPVREDELLDLIDSTTSHNFLCLVGEGYVKLRKFLLPESHDNDLFNSEARLRFDQALVLREGDCLWLDPSKDALACDAVVGKVVFVRLIYKQSTNLMWHFDPDSLLAVECSSARVNDTRSELCLQLLQLLDPEPIKGEILEQVAALSSSHSHSIRWEAARTLYHLDTGLGLQLIRELTADPHPHVAGAAAEALLQIDGT